MPDPPSRHQSLHHNVVYGIKPFTMFKPPRLGQALALIALACGAAVAPTVTAQDFALDVAGSDRYVRDGVLPQGLVDLFDPLGGEFKGGIYFSAGIEASYNSNLFLTEDYENSDFIFSVRPSIFYTSDPEGGAPFSVTAYYSPAIQMYTDNSSLNGIDHAFGAEFNILGGKTSLSIFANYMEYSGPDRFAGGFTEGSVVALGIRGSYQVAPRTRLHGMLTASMSDFGNATGQLAGGSGADAYVAQIGALWAATERLRFGPSIRYTETDSNTAGTRRDIALLLDAEYELANRIDLSVSIGPSFYEDSQFGGDSGVDLFVRLAADYHINERWLWTTSIRFATIPSPSNLNYIVNDYSLSTSVTRQFLRSSLECGASVNFSDYEASGITPTTREDETLVRGFLTYRRGLFRERAELVASLLYGSNSGSQDWEQWLFTIGVTAKF